MNSIEIIALVFAILAILKPLAWWLIKSEPLLKFAESMYKRKKLMIGAWTFLGAVLLYFLLSQLDIVQIWAGAAFGFCLFGIFLLQYPDAISKLARSILKDKRSSWFSWIVFIGLSVWVLVSLFA